MEPITDFGLRIGEKINATKTKKRAQACEEEQRVNRIPEIQNRESEIIRVLLIEDNPGDARLVREMLIETGTNKFNLEHVERISEGLNRLSQDNFQVILLDLSLPDSHGLETVDRVCNVAPYVPVLVLTGLDDETLAIRAVQKGAQDYLVKGQMDGNLLVRAIRYATERKRAEEALRESEERYRTILKNIEDGYFEVDIAGNFTFFNDSLCGILGYSRDEMMGMNNRQYMDKENAQKVYQAFNQVYTTGEPYISFDWEIVRKDGIKRFHESSVSLIRDSKGERIGFRGISRDVTDRKRAEEALRESEERYRLVVENSNDIIWTFGLSSMTFTFASRSVERILGYPVGTARGMTLDNIFFPETKRQVLAIFGKLAADEVAEGRVVFEAEHRHRNGGTVWLEINGALLKDDLGNPVGITGASRDITERKQAEERLRLQITALEAAANAIIITDHEGMIQWTNPAFTALTGYAFPEVVGKNPRELVKSGKQDQAFYKGLWDMILTGKVWRGQIINRRKDDSLYTEEMTITPLQGERGEISHFIAIKQDITERKQAEEALRTSQERFRQLFDGAPIGYHEIDSEGRFTRVNRTESEMLGYTVEEMLGQPAWNFIVEEEESRKAVAAKLAGVVLPYKGLERTYRRKDGTTFPVIIEDLLLRDSEGRIIGIRSTIQDITERKRAEEEMAALQEQLRQSQKMEAIGRLAGGIAHDFNNFLTVIKGYSQLSLLELKEDSPLKGNIEEINRATDQSADLIRQLLAFSRRQVMEMRVLDLNILLQNLNKMLRRVIGEDIELVTLLAEDLGRVKTDPGQIEQVILNLAVNARDAMPSGGKLTIETANVELDGAYARRHVAVTPGRYVMLAVSDTGVGMTPEVRDRVFEPFFTTKEEGKGTGLGLSTVYGIVKQSEGNIWIYSEPGHGTTFKIYFPQVEELLEEVKEKVVGEELPRGSETVLVVEDEQEVRKLAVRVLKRQGYKVLEASQGDDALRLCEEHNRPIQLMVTDVVMPGMDGRELTNRLMLLHPEIRVLYMSGYTDNTIVHHGVLERGINYIQKPFTVGALAGKVREVLDK